MHSAGVYYIKKWIDRFITSLYQKDEKFPQDYKKQAVHIVNPVLLLQAETNCSVLTAEDSVPHTHTHSFFRLSNKYMKLLPSLWPKTASH